MVETSRDVRRAQTAQRILEAARERFAESGYDGTTIRSIAAVAGVDPSLVMQHYGTKSALFTSAVQLPTADDQGAAEHLLDVLVGRLGPLPPETRALVQSMLTVPEAADAMRAYLDERVDNLAASLDGADEDARLRALLTVSGILGLTITKHFLGLRAFDGASDAAVIRAADGWVRSLAGTTGTAPSDR
jgi:AcrR family transcriptional regulator